MASSYRQKQAKPASLKGKQKLQNTWRNYAEDVAVSGPFSLSPPPPFLTLASPQLAVSSPIASFT